jgi:hypothetical protein
MFQLKYTSGTRKVSLVSTFNGVASSHNLINSSIASKNLSYKVKDMMNILEKVDLSEESREYNAALTLYDTEPVELLKMLHKSIDDKVSGYLTTSSRTRK